MVAGKAYQQSCAINIQSRKGGEKQVEGVLSQCKYLKKSISKNNVIYRVKTQNITGTDTYCRNIIILRYVFWLKITKKQSYCTQVVISGEYDL